MKVIALDLEGTLISNAMSADYVPMLAQFSRRKQKTL